MFTVDNDDQDWDKVSSDEHSSEECEFNCSVDAEMESDVVCVHFLLKRILRGVPRAFGVGL